MFDTFYPQLPGFTPMGAAQGGMPAMPQGLTLMSPSYYSAPMSQGQPQTAGGIFEQLKGMFPGNLSVPADTGPAPTSQSATGPTMGPDLTARMSFLQMPSAPVQTPLGMAPQNGMGGGGNPQSSTAYGQVFNQRGGFSSPPQTPVGQGIGSLTPGIGKNLNLF